MSSSLKTSPSLYIYAANTFYLRLRGLLGRRELQSNEALYIRPCSDVHTFGMKYKIDIVYLDKTGAVLKIDSLKTNRWSYCKGANSVLEFKAGCAQMHGFHEQLNVFSKNDVTVIPIGERV